MENYIDEEYTIAEEYTLPSLGKVYKGTVNPRIKIKSMNTEDEMKRLNPSDLTYKPLTDLIESCLVEKPGIPVYDLCFQDYEFLLHKLRIVTYGPEYKVNYTCPLCETTETKVIDMGKLEIKEFNEDMKDLFTITLPKTKRKLELRLLTPRLRDQIQLKLKEDLKRNNKSTENKNLIYTLQAVVAKIDGEIIDDFRSEQFFRHLPMMDTNYILKSIEKINFGINTTVDMKCNICNFENKIVFPITGEFFGPTID